MTMDFGFSIPGRGPLATREGIKAFATRGEELARQTKNIEIYPFEIALDNIRFFESRPGRFRLVTHYGITRDDIEKTLEVLDKIVN